LKNQFAGSSDHLLSYVFVAVDQLHHDVSVLE
jgi:hypothetical protein